MLFRSPSGGPEVGGCSGDCADNSNVPLYNPKSSKSFKIVFIVNSVNDALLISNLPKNLLFFMFIVVNFPLFKTNVVKYNKLFTSISNNSTVLNVL